MVMMFSPRARGCSLRRALRLLVVAVFPACAGMFLLGIAIANIIRSFPRVRGDVPNATVQIKTAGTVFPACAGMFLLFPACFAYRASFPRVRGDVPTPQLAPLLQPAVFPACAGMFLHGQCGQVINFGFPRVRGDVPARDMLLDEIYRFSPRARGCSAWSESCQGHGEVFPACAGMFRAVADYPTATARFPRVRGDVPQWRPSVRGYMGFSPRARGCSDLFVGLIEKIKVFPACAGMFRGVQLAVGVARCFPRVRGDVPLIGPLLDLVVEFSPRARGCSEDDQMLLTMVDVFPACAGMFPRKPKDTNQPNRFPRVRGDVPVTVMIKAWGLGFSPRARGCSGPFGADQ